MAEAKRARHGFVDALRGYVILLVVVCHVAGGVRNAGMTLPAWVFGLSEYSYSFFMPLMFLLSGLFIESAVRKGSREYALGRLRALVYPFVVWTLINGGVGLAAARYTNHPVERNVLEWFLGSPVGALWFIQALIVCQALYGALRLAGLGRWPVATVGIILTFVSTRLPDGVLAWSANAFGFFSLGSAASGLILDRLPKLSLVALLGFAAAFESLHAWLLHKGWPVPLAPLVAVCGSIAPLCVGVGLGNGRRLAPLRALGEASLAVFVLHTLVAAMIRIVLQKAFHFSAAWPHLILGVAGAFAVSMFLWKESLGRLPWLFRLPAKRVPVPDGAAA